MGSKGKCSKNKRPQEKKYKTRMKCKNKKAHLKIQTEVVDLE